MNRAHPILTIARKEYVENVRSAAVLLISGIFLVLTLLVAYYSRIFTPEGGTASLAETIRGMDGIAGFLVPILALIIAHATFAGEQEAGSLALLLAQPVTRLHVLAGKFIGLAGVLVTTVVVGFGIGGLYVGSRAPDTSWRDLGIFIGATALWASAWVSIAMFFSAMLKRRNTAIGASIATWFLFAVVWQLLFFLVFFILEGQGGVMDLSRGEAPAWAAFFALLNPNQAESLFLASSVESFRGNISGLLVRADLLGVGAEAQAWFFLGVLVLWVVLPLVGAWAALERKDL